MKKKKSLVALVAVFLVVVIGVTFAYFNSNAIFENQFNLGNYNVVTQEIFTSPDDWSPGDTTPKTLIATNNGTITAAVRVSMEEEWTDSNDDEIDSSLIPNNAVILNYTSPSQWTKVGDYYYYNYSLGAGESTTSLIESVTLNPVLNNVTCVEENGVQTCTSNIQGLAGAHYTLTFTIETIQYDKYEEVWGVNLNIGESPSANITLPVGRTVNNLQVGDEICIEGTTTECFNFIRYDGNDVVMLAKYNLNVGDKAKGTETNLQDSDAIGYSNDVTDTYGEVAFSAANYWYDSGNDTIFSKYGTWATNNVFDTDYMTVPNFSGNGYATTGYSIVYYVNQYKNILTGYGAPIKSARLLTYTEATDQSIGCALTGEEIGTCPISFITSTTFWLGSAHDCGVGIWHIYTTGGFVDEHYTNDIYAGVRPVIVIAKSDM